MKKATKPTIEYRNYELTDTPFLILTGENWTISDLPSNSLHFHNCIEIGICESGSGTIRLMNSLLTFSAGDIVILGKDICHTTYSAPGTRSKWSYIFINYEEMVARRGNEIFQSLLNPTAFENLIHNACFRLSKHKHTVLHNLITNIIDIYVDSNEYRNIEAFGLSMVILFELLNIKDAIDDSITNESLSVQTVNNLALAPALNYIQSNYMNDFSINDLAEMCQMSPTHFRRIFNQVMQTNPHAHIINTRIEKASLLLRSTEKSILEISEEVGFNSISSFNRHFMKIIGVPPLKWRHKNNFVHNREILKYNGWMAPSD